MRKISGTKVFVIFCSACFAIIVAGIMYTLEVPKKIVEMVNERRG